MLRESEKLYKTTFSQWPGQDSIPGCSNSKIGILHHDSLFIASGNSLLLVKTASFGELRPVRPPGQMVTVLISRGGGKLLAVSSVQRELDPSPVPTCRKAVDNTTSLCGLLYTALRENGPYLPSKERN